MKTNLTNKSQARTSELIRQNPTRCDNRLIQTIFKIVDGARDEPVVDLPSAVHAERKWIVVASRRKSEISFQAEVFTGREFLDLLARQHQIDIFKSEI